MANNGFAQRWQGKVLAKLLGIGSGGMTCYTATGGPINVTPNDLASLKGSGTFNGIASTTAFTINGYGITKVSSVGGGSNYILGAPVAGREAVIYTDQIGDGARKINSSAAFIQSSFGSTSAAFLALSTVAVNTLTLMGLSTSLWSIKGNVGSAVVSTA